MCRSKKNSQRILVNKRTGKLFIGQSEIYVNFERECGKFLTKYKVLKDDNYNILQSWDGSRIVYEKGREETIIEITKV